MKNRDGHFYCGLVSTESVDSVNKISWIKRNVYDGLVLKQNIDLIQSNLNLYVLWHLEI